jgi:hypothetical protein
MLRIYDCFCYFNEGMLLELRLETLWDHVDYFVICESLLTISGLPKELIHLGKDVLFPENQYETQNLTEQFPIYLVSNPEKFKDYLLRVDQ